MFVACNGRDTRRFGLSGLGGSHDLPLSASRGARLASFVLSMVLTDGGGGADAIFVAETLDSPPSSPSWYFALVAETLSLLHVSLRGL